MKKSKTYILPFLCLLCSNEVIAQSKDYYYENQTRYGTFRNYVNGGSKLVSGRDYGAEIAKSQEETKRREEERQRQRQLELERMRKTSNNTQVTPSTVQNDVRFETLKYSSGNTYTGKTLNGEPSGEGTFTFAASGQVMKGLFSNGQPNGIMTITGKNYVQTGKFENGKPVGDQRYDFDDGVTKLTEIRNMETGIATVQYPDKTSFSGISDENGKYLKGKAKYSSGITFDGDYKNGSPYRGVWEKDGRVMIGEFGESTPTELYLKFGYHYDPETNNQTYGSFSPGMKRIGYSRTVTPDNIIQHNIYGENEKLIYFYTQYPSGNILSQKANQDGYDYVGTYYKVATNQLDPVTYSKQNGIQEISPDNSLYEKAKNYSREVAPAINAGKKEYEAKLKEVQSYIDAYNSTSSSATFLFTNIQEAAQKFEWTYLVRPQDHSDVHRYLADGKLKFKTKSGDFYLWAFTNLGNAQPATYQYETVYEIEKDGNKNGQAGILIEIDEGNAPSYSKLIYLIQPETQNYYLGLFNPDKSSWTSFTSPGANDGWMTSPAIKGFNDKGISTNEIRLQKTIDEIHLYINDQMVFTQKIETSGKPLHKFAGIGIVQAGLITGNISAISFKSE